MVWAQSASCAADCAQTGTLHINPIIYAEVSIGFQDVTEVESVLSSRFFQRDGLPYEAAFLAGQAFLQYRRRGGVRRSPLPDFYIGAHGFVCRYTLLTRDATRYQTYFPELILMALHIYGRMGLNRDPVLQLGRGIVRCFR